MEGFYFHLCLIKRRQFPHHPGLAQLCDNIISINIEPQIIS